MTDSVLEVVAYEARRLFRDRLVSSKDLHTFDNILSSIIRGDWGSDALDNMTGMRWLNNKQIGDISLQIDCLMQFMHLFLGCHLLLNESIVDWLCCSEKKRAAIKALHLWQFHS